MFVNLSVRNSDIDSVLGSSELVTIQLFYILYASPVKGNNGGQSVSMLYLSGTLLFVLYLSKTVFLYGEIKKAHA